MGSFSWPYEGTVDAVALMNDRRWNKIPSCMEVMEIASENGVGFMLGDFGVRLWEFGNMDSVCFPRLRYPMDACQAMLRDITTTAQDQGFGWCFASWYASYGVAFGTPLFADTIYTQLEDDPYYIDQSVLDCFREINGALS